jgi:cell division protein FtsZ
LYNIVGSDLTLPEISLVSELIKEAVDPAANIKFGAQIDENAGDELTITIVATGFDEKKQVYTKKQQTFEPSVRTFGFEARETDDIEPEIDEEIEKEDLPSFEDDDMDVETPKPTTKLPQDMGEDPLDVPAFMRKK